MVVATIRILLVSLGLMLGFQAASAIPTSGAGNIMTPSPVLASTSDEPKEPETGLLKKRQKAQGAAFWQSLLVPGLGQLATGRPSVGYAFLTAETALVGSLIGLRLHAGRLEDDYRAYASQHAGVPPDKDHQYYVDMGNWMDTRGYNEARLRDRSFDALYTNPGDAWQWDSDNSRARFKTMRIKSDEARGTAVLVIGGLVINHLLAAVEAARGAAVKYDLGYAPHYSGGGVVTLGVKL